MPDIASNPAIRAARRDDLESLIELARRSWLSAFAQTAPLELIDWWARSARTRRLYEASWPAMFVLTSGSMLLGLVHPEGNEIHGLWVHPRAQGQGVGSRLLRFCEEQIRNAGSRLAWLTVADVNQRAMCFYRMHGYREVSRATPVHESGVSLEEVRMEKVLDA